MNEIKIIIKVKFLKPLIVFLVKPENQIMKGKKK